MWVGGIVPHRWCQWGGNSAPSLVSVGGLVPHRWCGWGEQCRIIGAGGGGIVGVDGGEI
ncbi:unnamed protein product, partial [Staurois parvus]